jgi:hypothetical protein
LKPAEWATLAWMKIAEIIWAPPHL